MCIVVLCIFISFFFMQKTAYEMRISDWSSDVCSSDLLQVCSDDNLYFLEQPQPGATVAPPQTPPETGSQLRRFEFKTGELTTVLKDLGDFRISADGKQVLVRQAADKLAVAELGKDKELKPEPVDLGGLRLRIEIGRAHV